MDIAAGHRRDVRRVLELDERVRLVLERIGGFDVMEAVRLGSLGIAHIEAGEYEVGLVLLKRKVELVQKLYGPRSGETAIALNNVGSAAVDHGDLRCSRIADGCGGDSASSTALSSDVLCLS